MYDDCRLVGAVFCGDEVVLHDVAEGLGVAIDGRDLGIGRSALEAGDEGLGGFHCGRDTGLRSLLLLSLSGERAEQLTASQGRIEELRELGVPRGPLGDHLVEEVTFSHKFACSVYLDRYLSSDIA
jgi:hypothetical protein